MVLKPLVPYFSRLNTFALTMWGENIPNNPNNNNNQHLQGFKYMKQDDEPDGMLPHPCRLLACARDTSCLPLQCSSAGH